jgi:hypothetical protein
MKLHGGLVWRPSVGDCIGMEQGGDRGHVTESPESLGDRSDSRRREKSI